MTNQTIIWKIMKDDVDTYNAEKHRLPCWNCPARTLRCFTEKKATKRAKYLRYTVRFEKACVEAILAAHLIQNAKYIVPSLDRIDRYDNPELFEQAVVFYTSSLPELNITGIASFIILVQRDPKYIGPGNYTAYHYLGYLFHEMGEEIDLAIDLYSRGIKLTPEESSIIENRGFCFLIKNDLKNALNDFERAKKLNGGCHSDLANIIDDIKIRQRGLKGNGKNYHQPKNPPKTIYELIGIPPEAFDLTA